MPSIILRLCDIQNHSEHFRIGLGSETTMTTTTKMPDITKDGTKILICGKSRTIIYYLHEKRNLNLVAFVIRTNRF